MPPAPMPLSRRALLTTTVGTVAACAVAAVAPAAAAGPEPGAVPVGRQRAGDAGSRAGGPAASGDTAGTAAGQPAVVAAGIPLAARVHIGAYVHLEGHPPADPVAPADLALIEAELAHRFHLVHYFFTWGREFGEALNSNADGRALMLSMKPDGPLVAEIAAGRQDSYIDRFARDAASSGRSVYLRFGHEMNGGWMSYSAGSAGGPPAWLFVSAWRRLVTRMRAQGAWNVRFVWCPNESDFPDRAGNHLEDYWPGDDTVDVAAFDAYNWSNRRPARGDGTWRTFEELVAGPYERVGALTGRHLWLGEFGTTEAVPGVDPAGADKGDWFRAMFATTGFPRLRTLVYFSEDDQRDVQRDWRIDSSPASIAGFREGWATGGAAGARLA